MLDPRSFEINACIPPVTPPELLLEFPVVTPEDLLLDGCDKEDKLIGIGLGCRKGDVCRATSPWSSLDPGTFFRWPPIARVVALLLNVPFDGESGLFVRIFLALI